MFQCKMLDVATIKRFWTQHSLPLEGAEPRTAHAINHLFIEARRLDQVWGAFVLNTVINAEKNGVQTVFTSYDDISEAYACFLIGYIGKLNN